MYPALEGEVSRHEHKVHDVSSVWAHVQTLEQALRSFDTEILTLVANLRTITKPELDGT
jgi:hypothetical protein